MGFDFSLLTYKQKALFTELAFLFAVCILIPFFIGLQIFSNFSWTIGLICVTALGFPSVILFYRWLLPVTFGKKRYWLFLLLFPVYIIIYELNSRLGAIAVIHFPFIPAEYRHNLESGHPKEFVGHWFNQTIGYTCLVLLANTSLYVVLRLLKNQRTVYQLETDKLKLELKHLKSQVQPHFFFNTLNNLYALSVKGSAKTSAMIASLSIIMRYVLYETDREKVALEREINFITNYVQLEKIRHDEPNLIDFAVQGDPAFVEIEPLLFLPLIENAFKHALQKDMPGKYVKMAMVVDDDELVFQISNSKQTTSLSLQVPIEGGIGLKNVKKRLELLYPGSHQLEVDGGGDIFNVILTIKLKQ
jgi:two-component system LytT family sensor kinase